MADLRINRRARDLLRAMNDRNDYRKRPPHDIMELQTAVRNVQDRLQRSKTNVLGSVQQRFPQRTAVTRFTNRSVLELAFPDADAPKVYVVRRSPDISNKYAKFWDINADSAIYIDTEDMTVAWGPLQGHKVRVNEHWTTSGLRR